MEKRVMILSLIINTSTYVTHNETIIYVYLYIYIVFGWLDNAS